MNIKPLPKLSSLPRLSLIALFLLSVFALEADGRRRERLVDNWRPLHYDVSLSFDDQLSTITEARTAISLQVLKDKVSAIDLDFGEMKIDGVTVGGAPARYEQGAGSLIVSLERPARLNERLSVVVTYHGQPKDGLVLTNDKDGRPAATGDNWPDRVHHWIPCLDHPSAKATVSFSVNVPAREMVVANGRFKGVSNISATTKTWTYQEEVPIPPYCMIVAIGEFARLGPPAPAVTKLSYYVPRSDANFAVRGFAPGAPSLKFFSQTIAPYPYEKLDLIIGATRFGGMENSSAIVFTSTLFDSRTEMQPMSRRFNIRQGIESVVAHEIAHQWFGDSVTESTWSDLWLSEGFATYFAALFIQKYEGEQDFRDYMKRDAEKYFAYERTTRTPIFDDETEDLFKLLNANNYQKGSWVLHMLRQQLGDAAFFRGLRAYYLAHRNATATTADLRAALEKSSGTNLTQFFARWIYGAGHPRYELRWKWQGQRGGPGTLAMKLRQLQADEAFPNPLPVEITSPQGTRRVLFRPRGKETEMSIRLARRPTLLRVDPDETVLKEASVSEEK
ncbi:MAG TPA: M1 family metallopeptidase [Pyrinomonadaceae bacterium]|jgi:aminopeptidase N